MTNRPPVLLADGYVNAGTDAPLRVRNTFAGLSKVQVRSGVFAGGIETHHDLTVVDDPASTTGKSATGWVSIAADVDPDRYTAEVLFPEWGIEQKNHVVHVDDTTPTDPVFAELVPGSDHNGRRMFNLRVSPVSRNITVADAATDIPDSTLNDWFGLIGDPHSGILNQNITTPLPIQPDTYTVRVRQRFANDDPTTWVSKDATVVLTGESDTKPGEGSFVVTHVLDPNKMGTKSILKHSVAFGDDHEQPNTRYGVSAELVVTNAGGGEPDLPDDIVRALRDLKPITINRQNDRVILTSGNPPILRQNHNFKIKYIVTIVPLKEEDAVNSEGEA